jgi:hypothetical protein
MNPDFLRVHGGAELVVTAYGTDVRLTGEERGVVVTIPEDRQRRPRPEPKVPGTDGIACDGCAAEQTALALEVR